MADLPFEFVPEKAIKRGVEGAYDDDEDDCEVGDGHSGVIECVSQDGYAAIEAEHRCSYMTGLDGIAHAVTY